MHILNGRLFKEKLKGLYNHRDSLVFCVLPDTKRYLKATIYQLITDTEDSLKISGTVSKQSG